MIGVVVGRWQERRLVDGGHGRPGLLAVKVDWGLCHGGVCWWPEVVVGGCKGCQKMSPLVDAVVAKS